MANSHPLPPHTPGLEPHLSLQDWEVGRTIEAHNVPINGMPHLEVPSESSLRDWHLVEIVPIHSNRIHVLSRCCVGQKSVTNA